MHFLSKRKSMSSPDLGKQWNEKVSLFKNDSLPYYFLLNFGCIFLLICKDVFSRIDVIDVLPAVVAGKMLLQALLLFTFCAQSNAYYDVNLKNIEPSLQAEAKYKHWHLAKVQSTDSGPFNYEMCKTHCFHPRVSYRVWMPDGETCPPQITNLDIKKVMLQSYPTHTPANVCLKKVSCNSKHFPMDHKKIFFRSPKCVSIVSIQSSKKATTLKLASGLDLKNVTKGGT